MNLIPINPVKERNYNRPSLARIKAFAKYLNDHHLTATIRQEWAQIFKQHVVNCVINI